MHAGLLQRTLVTGTVACAATIVAAALRGARDSGSAVAPINATSHVAWGETAGAVERIDAQHTLLGLLINGGASVFWSALYEKAFGRAADRGDVATALLGGGAVAALAYVTDYHLVNKRLTPGWEQRVSPRSLAMIYTGLGLSFALRGLLRRTMR